MGLETSHEDTRYYSKAYFNMNVLVCGNYNEEKLSFDLEGLKNVPNYEGKTYIKRGSHKYVTHWKYFFYSKDGHIGDNTFSTICDFIYNKDYKNLILFYTGLSSFTANDLINFYGKKTSNYQPSILIISKKYEYIYIPSSLNKNFVRTCEEDDIINIMINMIEIASYYNQLGDEIGFPKNFHNRTLLDKDNYLITKYPFTFNILLCGRPGVGKSTLINQILGKEKSYAKRGFNTITTKIVKYIHEKYPLVLYDSPGFETEKDISDVKNLIMQKNETLNEEKNKIHCVFYLLNKGGERGIYKKEYPFILSLIKNKMDIYIVATHAGSKYDASNYIETIKLQILQNANGQEEIKNLKNYIYPVEIDNEHTYNRFGINELFRAIYNKYSPEKIQMEIKQSNTHQIKSKFINDVLTKKELITKLTALALRVKSNFKLLAATLGTNSSVTGTTMLSTSVIKIISNIYNHPITTDECLKIIEKNGYTNELISTDTNWRLLQKFTASLLYFNGPASKQVDYISNYLINLYNNEMEDEGKFYQFLNNYRIAINKAIDSLNYINDY